MPDEGNGWREYQKLVLNELSRHEEKLDDLGKQVAGARRDITSLQVKSGLWGFFAGSIPALIAGILHFMSGAK